MSSSPDPASLHRLEAILAELPRAEGKAAARLWDGARAAMMRLLGPHPRVGRILRERSIEALAELVNELSASAAAADHPVDADQAADTPASPAADVSPDTLKQAMKAFRKRLKLKRLDDESKLGRSPLTSGKKAEVDAIMPPREYPKEVWDELVRQGKLRHAGGSFYSLVE